jgi:hypothetical protein
MNWLHCPKCQRLFVKHGEKIVNTILFEGKKCHHCNNISSSKLRSNLMMPTFLKDFNNYQMKLIYKDYADECVLEYEETHLNEKYEDYKMLVKEYRDGILLFTLMDQKVWTKALEDTTGLKNYHTENKGKYNWCVY